jgi:hypothetical protein
MRTRARIAKSRTRAILARTPSALALPNFVAIGVELSVSVGTVALRQRHALTATGVELQVITGAPSLEESGGVSLVASGLDVAMETGEAALTQVHALTATGIDLATEVGTAALGEAGIAIEIGSAQFIAGTGGSGPTLNILNIDTGVTSGPYTFFLATHPAASTLSKADIQTGSGSAIDHVSFSDADGAVTGQELTLSTSVTNGRLSMFIRSDNGFESEVDSLDGVTVDATAPTISAVTISDITATGAGWSVITNEAGGVVSVRVRLSSESAADAQTIIDNASDTASPAVAG